MPAMNDAETRIERLARKRADEKIGWYIHATAYICVNLVLVILSASSGRNWAIYPVLGWGLGLAIHGLMVFVVTDQSSLHKRLVQRERQRLTQQDAW